MNPLDSLVPPESHFLNELSEEQELEFRHHFIQASIRKNQRSRELRRRQRMAAMDAEASSDSEVEQLNKDVKDGKMNLTPAGSTPKEQEQELVKLDP